MNLKVLYITVFLISKVHMQQTSIKQKGFEKAFSEVLCNDQLEYFQEGISKDSMWARQMIDAWGTFPSGTFSGNLYDFGSFDQCINFKHNSENVGEILGQHCTLMIPFERRDSKNVTTKFMPPSRR